MIAYNIKKKNIKEMYLSKNKDSYEYKYCFFLFYIGNYEIINILII